MDKFEAIKDLNLFCRKLLLHKHFLKPRDLELDVHPTAAWDIADIETLNNMDALLDEQELITTSTKEILLRTRPTSTFCPPIQSCSAVEVFAAAVTKEILKLPLSRGTQNLALPVPHRRPATEIWSTPTHKEETLMMKIYLQLL
ncbi:hypothetical protein FKM82_001545 [Ascaphus truei]